MSGNHRDNDKTNTHVPLMEDTVIGHYRIVEKIGAGGMGEVYLAEDTELDRKVALKFLPNHLCQDEECRARFKREAQAAAKLDHPNIVTVHEVGEYQGRPYFAMAHVEGQSLKEYSSGKDLAIEQILELGIQICRGLQAAHDKGIIHRDIKPSNILIDMYGRARIVDFGLASVVGKDQLTKTGSTLGTIGYMSPEQVRGQEIDHRTDLFSLGVVLYELITKQNPFKRDSEAATLKAVSDDLPEPMARFKSGLPDGLQAIIGKALEKDVKARYQHADGLNSDLMRLKRDSDSVISKSAEASSLRRLSRIVLPIILICFVIAVVVLKPWRLEISSDRKSIAAENRLAIMQFDNIADSKDSLRLGEIVANLLITDLTESQYVQVVAGQRLHDILREMGHEEDLRIDKNIATQVAQKAGARWMLLGSILATEPQYVITAQLMDVESGEAVASQRISGQTEEGIFPIVDRLTVEIKKDLELPVASKDEDDPQVADLTTHSEEAYRQYLKGIDYYRKVYSDEAEACFRRAIASDSEFVMAYLWLYDQDISENEKTSILNRMIKYADNASTMEKLYVQFYQAADRDLDLNKAHEILEKLVGRYPDDIEILSHLAAFEYAYTRNYRKSAALYKKITEISPKYAWAYNMLAYAYATLGEFEKSQWALNKYLELEPDYANVHDTRADIYAYNGKVEEAIELYRAAIDIRESALNSRSKLGQLYLYTEEYQKAESLFQPLVVHENDSARYEGRSRLTGILAFRGRLQESLRKKELVIEMVEMESGKASRELLKALIDYAWFAGFHMDKPMTAMEMLRRADTILNEMRRSIRWMRQSAQLKGLEVLMLSLSGIQEISDSIYNEFSRNIDTNFVGLYEEWWFYCGLTELQKGNIDEAISNFQKAREALPVFSNKYYLARSFLEADRIGDAVEMFEQALSHYDNSRWPIESVLCHYYTGIAYEKSGWHQKAISQYEKFLDLWRETDPGIKEIEDARRRLADLKKSI